MYGEDAEGFDTKHASPVSKRYMLLHTFLHRLPNLQAIFAVKGQSNSSARAQFELIY